MILLLVAVSMAAKDGLATLLVIAEARGRHWLAGALDAAGDVAQVASMVFGAGEIILHGWGWRSAEILAVMVVTSFVGTAYWTWFGKRIKEQESTCEP